MNRSIILALTAAAALSLSACATSNIVAGSSSTYGIGAQTLPDGTAKGSIGATTADFVTVPLDRSKGTSAPYEVPTMCGGKDAVSTYGSISGSAAAGVTKGGTSLTLGRGLATGEPARLLALAELQTANPSINALREYHNCSQVTPPVPAAVAITPNP